MPDGPREPYRPVVSVKSMEDLGVEFTSSNTSGLTAAELVSLNRALGRLMSEGLDEYEAKVAIDRTVRAGLEPRKAAGADLGKFLGP